MDRHRRINITGVGSSPPRGPLRRHLEGPGVGRFPTRRRPRPRARPRAKWSREDAGCPRPLCDASARLSLRATVHRSSEWSSPCVVLVIPVASNPRDEFPWAVLVASRDRLRSGLQGRKRRQSPRRATGAPSHRPRSCPSTDGWRSRWSSRRASLLDARSLAEASFPAGLCLRPSCWPWLLRALARCPVAWPCDSRPERRRARETGCPRTLIDVRTSDRHARSRALVTRVQRPGLADHAPD